MGNREIASRRVCVCMLVSLARFLAQAQPSGRDADSEIHKFGDVSVKWALKLIEYRVD